MLTDPTIILCAAATIIALVTTVYIFIDDYRWFRAMRDEQLTADRAVQEAEYVHTRES